MYGCCPPNPYPCAPYAPFDPYCNPCPTTCSQKFANLDACMLKVDGCADIHSLILAKATGTATGANMEWSVTPSPEGLNAGVITLPATGLMSGDTLDVMASSVTASSVVLLTLAGTEEATVVVSMQSTGYFQAKITFSVAAPTKLHYVIL